jgi:hypothetical protein
VTDTGPIAPTETQLLTAAQAAGLDLRPMLDAIPEADEDAYVSIIRQIVNATTVEQLDQPWVAGGLTDYVDQWLEVRALRRMPSDFADGLGFYLIMDCKVEDTGEIVATSTGSVAVITQLIKANQLRVLPCVVRPVMAAKASRNGYKPMHLEFRRA